jgi:type I restriction enzyme, S subunit
MQIECFPNAPADWPRKVFADVAAVNPPYRLNKSTDYLFIEMAAVAEDFGGIISFDYRKADASGLARFKVGDILFGKITPCAENGKVALVKDLPSEFGLGSTEFIVLCPRNGNDRRFVYAMACANPVRGRAVSRMEGSTGRLRVTEDAFTKWLVVATPPEPEQRAIANILDAVGMAIERTGTAIEKAQRLKRGLIHQLFQLGVDSDGAARDLGDRRHFRSTPFGRFPVKWEVMDVEAEFDISSGFTLGEHRRSRMNRRKYLRVANVQREFVNLDDVAELEAAEREMEGRRLEVNDLLVVEGHADPDAIGRCAIVPPQAAGMTFQNHLFRLRSRRLDPTFAMLWLNSMVCRRYWKQKCSTSSGLYTINSSKLKRLPVVVPPRQEQEMIAQTIQASTELILKTDEGLRRLKRLKRGLMQDLLTGRVRAPVGAMVDQKPMATLQPA